MRSCRLQSCGLLLATIWPDVGVMCRWEAGNGLPGMTANYLAAMDALNKVNRLPMACSACPLMTGI